MERLTKRLEGGEYVSERSEAELLAELGRYEDFFESIEAEHELIRLNLETLAASGQQRSATYTMLHGSAFMLEDMQKRLGEPSDEVNQRLALLKRMIDDGVALGGTDEQ